LGPRGTGKSYFYSEFSPYSTLLSGGQASTATLLYNNGRKKVGAVGFWDNIAFDEVGNVRIKDTDTIQIMKDYMANGRFSRGQEVIANASFAFVGNIDQSIDQLVNSYDHNLFITLPKSFDLAIQDRFFFFLAGWEIPKMDNKFFTQSYGLITDYMAEAFHYMFKHNKDYVELVNSRLKLGSNVQGRDELAIKKSVAALVKIIHPDGNPTDHEFYELVEYAIEGRRRVKEQMNKTKPDDEFALINLSYFKTDGTETVVYCPESRNSPATQNPRNTDDLQIEPPVTDGPISTSVVIEKPVLREQRIKVLYGDTGYSYESLFKEYLSGATEIILEDSYIRQKHQISNFLRLCELIVKLDTIRKITLVTGFDDELQKRDNEMVFEQIADSLFEHEIEFRFEFRPTLHDRELKINNGWNIKMGRGLDFYQSLSGNYFQIGVNDLELRPCLETSFDFYRP
jgi:ATP-dependent Lon protease